MNVTVKHLKPGGTDPELLVLGATAGTLAWGGAWLGCGLPLPQCAFHAITGCPCPTCGATRSIVALLHGRVSEAVGWNPLVFAGVVALIVLNVYVAAVLLAGFPRLRVSLGGGEARFFKILCVAVLAGNWCYEIHHGV